MTNGPIDFKDATPRDWESVGTRIKIGGGIVYVDDVMADNARRAHRQATKSGGTNLSGTAPGLIRYVYCDHTSEDAKAHPPSNTINFGNVILNVCLTCENAMRAQLYEGELRRLLA